MVAVVIGALAGCGGPQYVPPPRASTPAATMMPAAPGGPVTPPAPVGPPAPTRVDAAAQYARGVEMDDSTRARVWGARAMVQAFPDESADGLRVDPHIFGPYPVNEASVLGFNTSVLVQTSQRDQARAALARCSSRFLNVSLSGHEYASYDEFVDALGDARLGTDDDVPSWVSDPIDRRDGVALVFDSDWMKFPMMVRMLKILRQELRAAGVTSAYVTSDPG